MNQWWHDYLYSWLAILGGCMIASPLIAVLINFMINGINVDLKIKFDDDKERMLWK